MSKTAIAWVAVVLVVLGGILYFWSQSSVSPSVQPAGGTQTQDTTPASNAMQGSTQTSADTSDAALQQDAASIDTQLQGASTDSNAAGSFNDTPVQQTE
jgi:hypothetical protein